MYGTGRLVTFAITVAVFGCTSASETDLIGTWQIADDSRESVHLPGEYRAAAGALTLSADGTFMALELPVELAVWVPPSPAEYEPALLSGGGTWKLGRAGSQVVRLSVLTVAGDDSGNLPEGYSFFIHPVFRGYRLVDYWGDPDVVPGIFYSRTGDNPLHPK